MSTIDHNLGRDNNPNGTLGHAYGHRSGQVGSPKPGAAVPKDQLSKRNVVSTTGTTEKAPEKLVDIESGRLDTTHDASEDQATPSGRSVSWCGVYRRFRLPIPIVSWSRAMVKVHDAIPSRLRRRLGAVGTVAIFLVGSFAPAETEDNTRANRAASLFGLVVMIFAMWITSRNRAAIPWHTVTRGMLSQFIIAVFVLQTHAGHGLFAFLSYLVRSFLGFAGQGMAFLTGNMRVAETKWFLGSMIPAVTFVIALISLFFHVGFTQWFISRLTAWSRVLGVSSTKPVIGAAKIVVTAATPFMGQAESAVLIRPYISDLTDAELHQIMTCGFATISGSVLASSIYMGLSAPALMSSCVMSIPASLAMSKLRYPETEGALDSGCAIVPVEGEGPKAVNALHAFTNGAWLGLRIAGMICSTVFSIVAFVSLVNGFLTWWGKYLDIMADAAPGEGLTLQLLLGYLFYPVAWLLGVPKQDLRAVGEIIGVKIVINEFVAFSALAENTVISSRGRMIAAYAGCGFGNIGSLGTQIGVLSRIAPGRAGDVSRVAASALITGIISTLSSAAIAGLLYNSDIVGATTTLGQTLSG
ncbi:CNT family concentrative nucleoside transporter [Xylaria sp. FL0043]|nr:CNT family concentrative nucleoside transporter [Xylaria sp. FL0043]